MNRLYSYGSCCAVPNCHMRTGTNFLSQVRSFRLPRNPVRRAAWLEAMNRQDWYPGFSSVVCSRHFIKGCPSKDPDDPDFIPSIFPSETEGEKLEIRKFRKGRRIQKRWKAPKKDETTSNDNNPSPSKKKKKPKSKNLVDSGSSATDEDADDALMGSSSDPDADDVQAAVPPPAPLPPQLSIPEKEFVLVGKRVVDVNYFVACLRRVNKHHNSMPCGISDMIICEEKVRGAQRGIVFRCKMCLLSSIVWLEDPGTTIAVEVATGTKKANKNATDDQIRNELYSMSGIKDFILPKPATLPKLPISRNPGGILPGQSQAPVIVQSHVPLIGYPQVAPIQQSFLSSTGVNAEKDGASSSVPNSPLVELKFCVEQPPIKQENVPATTFKTRRVSKRIALSPRMISKRHAEYLSSKSASTISKRHTAYLSSNSAATRPISIASQPLTGVNSEAGRITFTPGTSILQQHLQGTSTTAPKRILLSPADFQKIFSLSNSLPGQGITTTTVPQGILFNPQLQNTLQIKSVQSVPETAGTSRSILLPQNVGAPSSQSTSVQYVGSENSSSLSETITPDISNSDVLPVDLNLVKREKDDTASVQPSGTLSPTTIVPETITPDISAADALPVNLNLVKKEKE